MPVPGVFPMGFNVAEMVFYSRRISAKRITLKNRVSVFFTVPRLTLKIGSRFHPSKAAVILSGSLFQTFGIKRLHLELGNRTR